MAAAAAAERDARPGPPWRWPLAGPEVMRALDAHTIEDQGIAGEVLMESAGRSVVEAVLARWRGGPGSEVLVVCGGGNNGGDGLVVARHLHGLGVPVRALLLSDPKQARGDAATALRRARAVGVPLEQGRLRPPRAGVVVDAIFGTGLSRKVEGAPARAIRRLNAARGPDVQVVAVDAPSGIDGRTGAVHGVAVEADLTVTVSLPKPGLLLEPGRRHAGRLLVARVGIADATPRVAPDAETWSAAWAGALLPARPPAAHKGTFGHVLVAAGSQGKTGAAALAAAGAGRAGAGLVTVACPAAANDVLEVKCTEAMTAPLPDTLSGGFAATGEAALLELAAERDVLACGPGLGRDGETQALVRAAAARVERPLVLDADGLFAFAGRADELAERPGPSILTPHPGEAARLLALGRRGTAEINADRLAAARELARRTGCVVLLKGAASVVAEPPARARGRGRSGARPGRAYVNPTGGPGLASGGTGDVLTGVVAGLWAQLRREPDAGPFEVAALAAYVHGAASDRLAARHGPAGLLAEDLARELPDTLAALGREARAAGLRPGNGDADDGDGWEAAGPRGRLGLLLPCP